MLPGYFSFVQGESTVAEFANLVRPAIANLFYRSIYEQMERDNITYRWGINRLVEFTQRLAEQSHIQLPDKWIPCYYHYYNRQLIVQMTSHPRRFEQSFRGVDVPLTPISVPLERHPGNEVQIDLMQLLPHQLEHNFKIKYLVVIVETFSRFVWAFPVSTTESRKVASAFASALSRPGIALQFYEHIRNKVKRVLVDGGSEFKDVFRDNVHHVFPNAQLVISGAKRTTLGRPTSNGPVEAAIRSLRRVLRDYEISVEPGFYHSRDATNQRGLEHALKSYNVSGQMETLDKNSPKDIVDAIIGDDLVLLNQMQEHMDSHRNLKITLKQAQQQQTGSRFLIKNAHGTEIYRLYLQPGAFAKEVDFRVSLEIYYISRVHPGSDQKVDLTDIQTGKVLPNQRMSNLVLVKNPVMMGPLTIYRNLKREYVANRFTAADRAQVTRPYEVSQAIIQAVQGHAGPANRALPIPAAAPYPRLPGANAGGALPAPPLGVHPHLRAPAPLGPQNPAPPRPPPQGFYHEPVDNEPTRRSTRERRGVDRLTY